MGILKHVMLESFLSQFSEKSFKIYNELESEPVCLYPLSEIFEKMYRVFPLNVSNLSNSVLIRICKNDVSRMYCCIHTHNDEAIISIPAGLIESLWMLTLDSISNKDNNAKDEYFSSILQTKNKQSSKLKNNCIKHIIPNFHCPILKKASHRFVFVLSIYVLHELKHFIDRNMSLASYREEEMQCDYFAVRTLLIKNNTFNCQISILLSFAYIVENDIKSLIYASYNDSHPIGIFRLTKAFIFILRKNKQHEKHYNKRIISFITNILSFIIKRNKEAFLLRGDCIDSILRLPPSTQKYRKLRFLLLSHNKQKLKLIIAK